MKKLLFFVLISCTLISCSHNKAENVENAFYYWKSDAGYLDKKEDSAVKNLRIHKLYVKFFEVESNAMMGNIPISKTDLGEYSWWSDNKLTMEIVPVVYLKNEVFLKSSKDEIDTLVSNVYHLIKKYEKEKFTKALPVSEIQMDCDWTLKSKDNYFYFLRQLKKISGQQLSCTLRLYPYKYPEQMGVPPVDKAMLMCYNLINPMERKDKNSILDNEELSAYLDKERKYPVHLDIALPIYSWMHVFQNDHFTNVLYPENTIKKILKPVKPMWYEVTKDTVINNAYLRVGDNVKFEEMNAAKIHEAIKIIKDHVVFDRNITVSLFHLDKNQLNNYNYETLSRFYSDFSK